MSLMGRAISTEVYKDIVASGKVARDALQVLSIMVHLGGEATAGEISQEIKRRNPKSEGSGTGRDKPAQVHARLNDLMELDIVCQLGKRPCRASKRSRVVTVYGMTGRLPTQLKLRSDLSDKSIKVLREMQKAHPELEDAIGEIFLLADGSDAQPKQEPTDQKNTLDEAIEQLNETLRKWTCQKKH